MACHTKLKAWQNTADTNDVTGYGEFPTTDCLPDTVNGAKFVRDLYEKVDDNAGNSCVSNSTPGTAHSTGHAHDGID